MAINIDQITVPALPGYFLEVKSRTWSRHDAKRKAELITALLEELGVDVSAAERKEYVEIAMAAA